MSEAPSTLAAMSFVANVLTVMIVSPSDVTEARDAIEKALHGWNGANSRNKQVVLQPWRWETSAVPVMGDHPQSLINAQGVDGCDLVFGIFGSRLGSPTLEAVSGTVEEIERAQELGKPVHLYFSSAPLPNDVDIKQLEGLRSFKKAIQERGLLGEFANASQLEHEVWKAIEHDLSRLSLGVPNLASTPPAVGVKFHVQPQQERELKGHTKAGKPQYTTRHWLEITNVGDVDAQEVVFENTVEQPRMHLGRSGESTVIHAGQMRRLGLLYMMGGEDGPLRIRWREDGEDRSAEFHVN